MKKPHPFWSNLLSWKVLKIFSIFCLEHGLDAGSDVSLFKSSGKWINIIFSFWKALSIHNSCWSFFPQCYWSKKFIIHRDTVWRFQTKGWSSFQPFQSFVLNVLLSSPPGNHACMRSTWQQHASQTKKRNIPMPSLPRWRFALLNVLKVLETNALGDTQRTNTQRNC